jgi:hypothetical protein
MFAGPATAVPVPHFGKLTGTMQWRKVRDEIFSPAQRCAG